MKNYFLISIGVPSMTCANKISISLFCKAIQPLVQSFALILSESVNPVSKDIMHYVSGSDTKVGTNAMQIYTVS